MSVDKSDMRVAAIQMVSKDSVERNLEQAEALIKDVCLRDKPALIVLPENFALFDTRRMYGLGIQESGPAPLVRSVIAEWACRYSVDIVAGSLPLATRPDGTDVPAGKVRTSSLLFSAEGLELARYDKMHLFDVDVADGHQRYRESDTFEPGDTVVVHDTAAGRIGLSICYDLRFPYLYSRLRNLGAELLSVPAAFTYKTGEAHWEVLLRARAIENQCYVIAANQGGVHSESRQTWGHTMIVSPWGDILSCVPTGEGYAVASIDRGQLIKLRAQMPLWQHQRTI